MMGDVETDFVSIFWADFFIDLTGCVVEALLVFLGQLDPIVRVQQVPSEAQTSDFSRHGAILSHACVDHRLYFGLCRGRHFAVRSDVWPEATPFAEYFLSSDRGLNRFPHHHSVPVRRFGLGQVDALPAAECESDFHFLGISTTITDLLPLCVRRGCDSGRHRLPVGRRVNRRLQGGSEVDLAGHPIQHVLDDRVFAVQKLVW